MTWIASIQTYLLKENGIYINECIVCKSTWLNSLLINDNKLLHENIKEEQWNIIWLDVLLTTFKQMGLNYVINNSEKSEKFENMNIQL